MRKTKSIIEEEMPKLSDFMSGATLDAIGGFFSITDIKDRCIHIDYEIDEDTIQYDKRCLLQYLREDVGKPVEEREPIFIYVDSPGGSVSSGLELIDLILNSKTPIYTICTGIAHSMAFLIMLAGHKRYATRNASLLMHDGLSFICDSTSKVRDQIEFNSKTEERIKQFVISRSNLKEDEYDSKYRVEWYMYADEAKANGFIDGIIGEDIDMEEVL